MSSNGVKLGLRISGRLDERLLSAERLTGLSRGDILRSALDAYLSALDSEVIRKRKEHLELKRLEEKFKV
jgi:hypothetical protein